MLLTFNFSSVFSQNSINIYIFVYIFNLSVQIYFFKNVKFYGEKTREINTVKNILVVFYKIISILVCVFFQVILYSTYTILKLLLTFILFLLPINTFIINRFKIHGTANIGFNTKSLQVKTIIIKKNNDNYLN